MAKSNPELETYLRSQANSLSFILQLISSIDQLPSSLYHTPKLARITILGNYKISLERAWQIVSDYLNNHDLPYHLRHRTQNLKLTRNNVFLIHLFLEQAEIELHNLDPIKLQALVDQHQASKLAPTPEITAYQKALEVWKQQIHTYNHQLRQISQQFDPNTILPVGGSHFFSQPQASQLASQLTQVMPQAIKLASQLNSKGQLTPHNLHLALAQLLPQTPTTRTFLSLLHNPTNRQRLFDQIQATSPQLMELANQQTNLALNPPPTLSPTAIKNQIHQILSQQTNLPSHTTNQLAQDIVKQLQLASLQTKNPSSTQAVIQTVLRQHNLTTSPQLMELFAPIIPHLNYFQQRQAQYFHLIKTHHAANNFSTWIRQQIIKETGIDPQILLQDRLPEIKRYLETKNSNPEQLLNTLQDKLQTTHNTQEINLLLDYADFLQQKILFNRLESKTIKLSTKLLIRAYKNNALITASLNRYALAYQQGINLYLKADNILTGRFLFEKIDDKLRELSFLTNLGVKWQQFLNLKVDNLITSLQYSPSNLAPFAKKVLEIIKLSNFRVDSFIIESTKAIWVYAYTKSLDFLGEASRPIIKHFKTSFNWISQQLITSLNSDFFSSLSKTFEVIYALGLQGGMLIWNLGLDVYHFFRDLFKAFSSPTTTSTIKGIFRAFRQLFSKLTLGTIGGVTASLAAAIFTPWSLPGIIVAFFTGFFLGRNFGKFLNKLYDNLLKPATLFIISLFAFLLTSFGVVILGAILFTLLPLAVFIGIIIFIIILYFIITFSARLPENVGNVSFQYIQVTKHATATWSDKTQLGHIDNDQLPQDVTYKITIRGRSDNLSNIIIKDKATLLQEGGRKTILLDKTVTPTNDNGNPMQLTLDDTYTYEYTIHLPPEYKDALLSNSVEVTAEIEGLAEPQVASTGVTITIGTPPLLPLAQYAIELADAIRNNCVSNNQVSYQSLFTITCEEAIRKVTHANADQVLSLLRNSALYYQNTLQCVGFVKAVIAGTGQGTAFIGQSLDYAGQLTSTPMNGFHRVYAPQPGDIVIFPVSSGMSAGHIAVVITVAGPTITVADANIDGPGLTRSSSPSISTQGLVFYRPND